MAVMTGNDINVQKARSSQQRENRALEQLSERGAVELPTGPTGPEVQTQPIQQPQIRGAGPVFEGAPAVVENTTPEYNAAAALFGANAEVATGTPRPADGLKQRALPDQVQDIARQQSVAPSPEQVLQTPSPRPGGGFKSRGEAEQAYATELDKQAIPRWSDVSGRIEEQQTRVDEGDFQYSEKLSLDNDFDADFDADLNSPPKPTARLRTDLDDSSSEAGFITNSDGFTTSLQEKLSSNEDIQDSFIKAGIADPLGNIDPEAAKALMFTLTVEQRLNEVKRNDDTKKAIEFVDAFNNSDGKVGLSEADFDKHSRYAILHNSLDRQGLQSSLIPRFNQIIGNADAAGSVGRVSAPDQTKIVAATMAAMEEVGLVTSVKRTDPDTGRDRSGYEPTARFIMMSKGISAVLGEYESKLFVDVSLSPLVDGVPVGEAAEIHKSLTRSGPKTRLGDNVVREAMDLAGKQGWIVDKDSLTLEALKLSMLTAVRPDGVFRTYDHPLASDFLLDTKSFMKYMPTATDVKKSYDAQLAQWTAQDKKFKAQEQGNPLDRPTISEASQASYRDFATLRAKYNELSAAATVDPNMELELDDFIDRVIYPAVSIQQSVSGAYIKDILDGARLNNQTFYYPQTAQAGTTRVQVGTSTLNYQNSKKARSMVASPHPSVVKTRSVNDMLTGKAASSKQIDLEAMIARNLEEGGSIISDAVVVPILRATGKAIPFHKYDAAVHTSDKISWVKPSRTSEIEHQAYALHYALANNPKLGQVAKFVAQTANDHKGSLPAWASQVAQFNQNKLLTTKKKFIRPDIQPNFPKMETNIDLAASGQVMLDMSEMMGLGKPGAGNTSWTPNGKSDHAGFVMNALKTLGDYTNPAKGMVQTHLTVEIDGIASGLTIQGYQYGEAQYLEHGGVLYEGDSTTPKGDIRNMIHNSITTGRIDAEPSTLELMGYNEEQKAAWQAVYDAIKSHGKTKDLHKKAAMTVAYSQEPKSAARGSVDEFAGKLFSDDALFTELEAIAVNQLGFTDINNLYDEMAVIEKQAITQSLGASVRMAEAVQNGSIVAAIADEEYIYKLNNGHEMIITGSRNVEIDQFQFEGKAFTTYKTITDNAERAQAYGDYLRAAGSKIGKFAAVGPTQGMDAEISQRTIIEVNKKLGVAPAPGEVVNVDDKIPLIGQVFDAFILNTDSYRAGREAANRQFVTVNRATDQAELHIQAVHNVMSRLKKKMAALQKAGKMVDVSPTGEYAAAFEAFRDISQRTKSIRGNKKFNGVAVAGAHDIKAVDKFLHQDLKFDNTEGAVMQPQHFYKMVSIYLQQTAAVPVLKEVKRNNDKGRADVEKRLRQQMFEGRSVVQYG